MPSRLFVGNLPYDATEDELRAHFSQAGTVNRVFIPLDRDTGRPRGFAFIEYSEETAAAAAIQQLNQQPFKDRPLVVNEARPNEARPSGPGRPGGVGRPPGGGVGRPPSAGGPSGPPPGPGEGARSTDAPRRSSPPRRRSGKGGGWDERPKKEPIPEMRRSQFFGDSDDSDEDEEDVEFENFATSLPDPSPEDVLDEAADKSQGKTGESDSADPEG